MHWRFGAKGNFVPILKKQEKKEKDRQARRKGEEEGGKEPTCPTRGAFVPCLVYFCCPHHPLANSYEDSGAIVCLLPGITASLKVSIKSLLELE